MTRAHLTQSLIRANGSGQQTSSRFARICSRILRSEDRQYLTDEGVSETTSALENLRVLFGVNDIANSRASMGNGADIPLGDIATASQAQPVALTPEVEYTKLSDSKREELAQLVKNVMYGADRTAGDRITTLAASVLTGITAAQLAQIATVTAMEKLGISLTNINQSVPFRIGLGATIAGASVATCVILSCKSCCQTTGYCGRGEDKIKDMIRRGSEDLKKLSPEEIRKILIVDTLAKKVSEAHEVDVGKSSDPAKLVLASLCLGYAISALYLGASLAPTITTAVTAGVTAGGVVAKSANSSGPDNVDKMLANVSSEVETKLGRLMTKGKDGTSPAVELKNETGRIGRARKILSNLIGLVPGCGPSVRSYRTLKTIDLGRDESY